MSLYDKLKFAVAGNSDSKATLAMYWHWSRQFYGVVRIAPAEVNFLA